jgi:L-arabinose isomerase
MITIHVWADGSFTTQQGGKDMSAWAEHQQAAKHGCIRTVASGVMPTGFREEFQRLSRDLEIPHDGVMGKWQKRSGHSLWPNAQAWQLWASVCIAEFGAWFTDVTGPKPDEVLSERLIRLIRTRDECSIGVLVNLVRPISKDVVRAVLDEMEASGKVQLTIKPNPKNHLPHRIYTVK